MGDTTIRSIMHDTAMWSSQKVWPLLPVIGLAGVLWALTVLPSYRSALVVHDRASRIINDGHLKRASLRELTKVVDGLSEGILPRPGVRRDAAVILTSIAERDIDLGTPAELDEDLDSAELALRSALAIDPADGLLWLMLYSIANTRGGFDKKNLNYLHESYRAAPLEGWLATRRNRFTLAILRMLPVPTRQRAASEFAGLVDSGFVDYAATNFKFLGLAERDFLLESLKGVSTIYREAFAKQLTRDGIRAHVPGVQISERPWP